MKPTRRCSWRPAWPQRERTWLTTTARWASARDCLEESVRRTPPSRSPRSPTRSSASDPTPAEGNDPTTTTPAPWSTVHGWAQDDSAPPVRRAPTSTMEEAVDTPTRPHARPTVVSLASPVLLAAPYLPEDQVPTTADRRSSHTGSRSSSRTSARCPISSKTSARSPRARFSRRRRPANCP